MFHRASFVAILSVFVPLSILIDDGKAGEAKRLGTKWKMG